MLNTSLRLAALALALACGPVFAHAVITETSVTIAPVTAGRPTQISLVFNAKVELGLSQFHLVKKGDIREKLNARKGRRRGEVIVELPALAAGEHALSLKVLAADGHLTEDLVRFHVLD